MAMPIEIWLSHSHQRNLDPNSAWKLIPNGRAHKQITYQRLFTQDSTTTRHSIHARLNTTKQEECATKHTHTSISDNTSILQPSNGLTLNVQPS